MDAVSARARLLVAAMVLPRDGVAFSLLIRKRAKQRTRVDRRSSASTRSHGRRSVARRDESGCSPSRGHRDRSLRPWHAKGNRSRSILHSWQLAPLETGGADRGGMCGLPSALLVQLDSPVATGKVVLEARVVDGHMPLEATPVGEEPAVDSGIRHDPPAQHQQE